MSRSDKLACALCVLYVCLGVLFVGYVGKVVIERHQRRPLLVPVLRGAVVRIALR